MEQNKNNAYLSYLVFSPSMLPGLNYNGVRAFPWIWEPGSKAFWTICVFCLKRFSHKKDIWLASFLPLGVCSNGIVLDRPFPTTEYKAAAPTQCTSTFLLWLIFSPWHLSSSDVSFIYLPWKSKFCEKLSMDFGFVLGCNYPYVWNSAYNIVGS